MVAGQPTKENGIEKGMGLTRILVIVVVAAETHHDAFSQLCEMTAKDIRCERGVGEG